MLLHLDQSQSVLYKVYNISGSSVQCTMYMLLVAFSKVSTFHFPFASKKLFIEAPHGV